jgi:hypothetical protein
MKNAAAIGRVIDVDRGDFNAEVTEDTEATEKRELRFMMVLL